MAQKFKITELLTTDSKQNAFTGIPNVTLPNKIVQLVERHERENKLEATAKDRVLFVFIILRHVISLSSVGVLFQCSAQVF